MHFDGTIRLGDVVLAFGFLAGGFALYGRFTVMESRVGDLWEWWIEQFPDARRKHKHSAAHD